MPDAPKTYDAAMLWPPTFSAAIFDFDGTIADTADLWHEVDIAWLAARNLPFSEEFPREISALGFVDGARYAIERYGLDERVEDICDEWNRMGRELYATRVHLRPGAERYIRALREKGVRCALATVNDPDVILSMQPNVDVEGLFDAMVCACDVSASKHEPDIYLEAARRLGAKAADCMVFEDLAVGLRSAKSVGMVTCAVRSGDLIQKVDEVRDIADLFIDGWEGVMGRC